MLTCPSPRQINQNFKYALAVFALLFFTGFQVIQESRKKLDMPEYGISTNTNHPYMKELQDWMLPEVEPRYCIRSKPVGEYKLDYTICVKTEEEDAVISGAIIEEGMFEAECVGVTADIAHLYPQATFIDIGANIGIQSLAALKVGCKVIAVEPLGRNLAFISKSAHLMNKRHKIRYLQNVVSDTHEIMYPEENLSDNGGGISFANSKSFDKKPAEETEAVKSIILEDIMKTVDTPEAFIKIDAEGMDCKVIRDHIPKLNKRVYVPYIMMEWMIVLLHDKLGQCKNIDKMIQDFINAGYTPYEVNLRSKINKNRYKFPFDNIVWVHKDAKRINLNEDTPHFVVQYGNGAQLRMQ